MHSGGTYINTNDNEFKLKLAAFKRRKVYFEKQANDRLCGIHCLNTLMQGPYFDVITLSEIAQSLDELERNLLGEDFNELRGLDDHKVL